MSWIAIDRLTADGSTLECDLRPSRELRRFVTNTPFRVEYDRSIEAVPDGILAIPVLANVCPVAWANGADVYVDEVDRTFAHALEDVKASLLELHDFLEGGTLYARRTIDPLENAPSAPVADGAGDSTGATDGSTTTTPAGPGATADGGSDSALLFTGGVDSTYAYVSHRTENPTLVSIRGWTITPDHADDEKWAHLCERVSSFAADHDLETAFIETNALSALDHAMLLAHYKRYVDGAWYSSVGHGLGLLGLCAPMAYTRGIEDLYVAATHWEGIDLEWGSRPDIDDHVRWSGTQCHHDGYDRTRQERIDAIADYVDSEAPTLELQTCNVRMDGNCGECEKCYRTAVGLRLAGLNPTAHGYPFADADYDRIRRSLEAGAWDLGEDERYMWADIRNRVRETEPDSPRERAFFEWLLAADLEGLVADADPPLSHRVLRAGARNTPTSVYNLAYPMMQGVQSRLRRIRPGQ
ncbi:hypothetical protein D8Y22_03125 [Salinadaptatus halalkaliphilus]|uniref:Uncharacterized protein n=1 Tax=Salinadaptatus halalkaliphilus TaxID=2419781 RepID=A0A4S3TRJ3_9EURY|nr:hypothetical protein [Salinadaptatus halalkaliphilus]THE66280.1 hypothetical protein D8Y22_03125 [Salinadaptatus halalkaliphilus]